MTPSRMTTPGEVPGSLHIADDALPSLVTVLAYGPDDLEEGLALGDVADFSTRTTVWPVTWVNVSGLGTESVLLELGRSFGIHPLALEDVVNAGQRPKAEDYGDQLFLVARLPSLDDEGQLATEQISMFLGPGFLITFQESHRDSLAAIRERIRAGRGRIRKAGADYLCYAILDTIVDSCFPILEDHGDRLEDLEDEVLDRPRRSTVESVHQIKQNLVHMGRVLLPLRDVVAALRRDEEAPFLPETRLHLRDCLDHAHRVVERVESGRDTCSDLMTFYISSVSQRTNEVMKVLAVLGAVFLPLSFIAGLYGMNFDPGASRWSMPELRSPLGYPLTLLAMVAIAVGMLWHFRRRGWLGGL